MCTFVGFTKVKKKKGGVREGVSATSSAVPGGGTERMRAETPKALGGVGSSFTVIIGISSKQDEKFFCFIALHRFKLSLKPAFCVFCCFED